MKRLVTTALVCVLALQMVPALADKAEVTWLNSACRYFVVKLPENNEPEKFGLFSARNLPLPNVGDRLKGSMTAIETQLENLTSGDVHSVIHWADAKTQEQLLKQAAGKCSGKTGGHD